MLLLETVLNISLTGIILFDPLYDTANKLIDLTYRHLNSAAQQMLSLPMQPTQTFLTLYPHAMETGIFAFYRDTFLSGKPGHYRVNYSHDGLDNYFHLAAQRSGTMLVVSFTDTSGQDRSEVEEALRKSQAREQKARNEAQQGIARLERLLLQAPVAIAIFQGPAYLIELANPMVLYLWGRSAEQALNTPLFDLLPEAANQGFQALLDEVMATGEPYMASEYPSPIDRHGRRDTVYWNFVYQPWRDELGVITGVMVIATEVTEQVIARQKVQSLNEEVMAGNEELRATNEELLEVRQVMEQFIRDLDKRVAERTQELTMVQAALESQKGRLERFFYQAPAAICVLDGPDLTFELINPGYQNLFPGRALLGKPVLEALPEIVGQPIADILFNVYRTGETFEGREIPIALVRQPGAEPEESYFNFIYQARFNEQGATDGILVFAFEVTESVLTRKRVEESEHRFRVLSESIPQIVWRATPDGNLDYFSGQWWAYSGMNFEQSVGQGWANAIHPGDRENLGTHWAYSLATGERYQVEARVRRADGIYRWFLIRAVPLRNEAGALTQWMGTCTDLQEQKETQEQLHLLTQKLAASNQELAASNEELAAANEEISANNEVLTSTNQQLAQMNTLLESTNVDLDNFIYTASHDLKAPIANIEGLMKLMVRSLPQEVLANERVSKPAHLIGEAVERFKRTIASLTEVTKLQKEGNQVPVLMDLSQIVREVRLDLAPQIEAAKAVLNVDVNRCPAIQFSEKNLRSVVYNLLSNALKYRHPDRVPIVAIGCQRESQYVILSVGDNGLGIDLSKQSKLFAMFGRLHDHVEGSGVGLYMVKKMVENAGGKIEVESQVGVGTTFRVYFPQ